MTVKTSMLFLITILLTLNLSNTFNLPSINNYRRLYSIRRPHHLLTSPYISLPPSSFALFSTSPSSSPPKIYDVVIFGSGPTSLSLASLLTSSPNPPTIAVVSSNYDEQWIPNYGSWTHEWEVLSSLYSSRGVPNLSTSGIDHSWSGTDCYFTEGQSDSDSLVDVGAAYVRLSRTGLRDCFTSSSNSWNVIRSNHDVKAIATNVYGDSVRAGEEHTTVTLEGGGSVTGRIIVDGTGAESKLTIRKDRKSEGYQIAYGVECNVSGPGVDEGRAGAYRKDRMTLFDYRTDFEKDEGRRKGMEKSPTFMYVMPLGGDRVFFEETSLVANPGVSFEECKERCTRRLEGMGVEIGEVYEEEFCYIPMGGEVTGRGQRIVPIGAASGMVHPSTGYQICRTLSCNLDFADAILRELKDPSFSPDVASARINDAVWTPEAIRQRNFAVFGGDFLMKQKVSGLQGFFSGFFKLPFPLWTGFLAGMKNLPNNDRHETWYNRLIFGVTFLTKLPPSVGLSLVLSIITYSLENGPDLIQSVTPLLGEPKKFKEELEFRDAKGDMNAKKEAMSMCACKDCYRKVEVDARVQDEQEKEPS